MVNGKYIFNVHWPNRKGLVEGFCIACEQPWVYLNPRPFALKATTLTTAPRRHDVEPKELRQISKTSVKLAKGANKEVTPTETEI